MSISYLPNEIQWKILSCLDLPSKIQYSSVCKHWRKVASKAIFKTIYIRCNRDADRFVGLLLNSPCIGASVHNLDVRTDRVDNDPERYANIIRMTPNVRSLLVGESPEALYQIVLQEVQLGHWRQLNYVHHDSSCIDTDTPCQAYYALVSAVQDRSLDLVLNISSVPDSLETHCFQDPLLINRQTRFNAVECLNCYSDDTTTIQSLDDALSLCPNAASIELSVSNVKHLKDQSRHIEPNTKTRKVQVSLSDFSETELDYICHKFPNADEVRLTATTSNPEHPEGNLSVPMANRLACYVRSLERFDFLMNGFTNSMRMFHAFALLQGQSRMAIYLEPECIELMYNSHGPKRSELCVEASIHSHILEQPSSRAYLSQLDGLHLRDISPINAQILAHCTQLQALKMIYDTTSIYRGPVLTVTDLSLSSSDGSVEFLRQFQDYIPRLKIAKFFFGHLDTIVIDMPSISFKSLFVNVDHPSAQRLYLHVKRSRTEKYYQSNGKQLREIEASKFGEPEPEMAQIKVKLICKDIQSFRIEKSYQGAAVLHHF